MPGMLSLVVPPIAARSHLSEHFVTVAADDIVPAVTQAGRAVHACHPPSPEPVHCAGRPPDNTQRPPEKEDE